MLYFSFPPFQTITSQQCLPGHPPAKRHACNIVSACALRIVCFLAEHEAASICCKSVHISPCLIAQMNVSQGLVRRELARRLFFTAPISYMLHMNHMNYDPLRLILVRSSISVATLTVPPAVVQADYS